MINKVYFDLDGVLADFVKGYSDRYGDITKQSKKEIDSNKPNFAKDKFFLNLPVIKDGISLLRMTEKLGYTPIILTAVGDNDTAENQRQKSEWVKMNLGNYEFHGVKKARMKAKYAAPDALLIDDRLQSTKPFESAGGNVLLFKDAKHNVKELIKYLT